jgi:hypothetical protein
MSLRSPTEDENGVHILTPQPQFSKEHTKSTKEETIFSDSMPSPLSGLRVLRDLRGEKAFRRTSVLIDRLKNLRKLRKFFNYSTEFTGSLFKMLSSLDFLRASAASQAEG